MPPISPTGKGGKEDGADTQLSWQRRMGLQRQRRQATEVLWGRLDELVACEVDACGGMVQERRYGNHRAQALKSGRTREELLKTATTQVRRLMEPRALERAYTTRSGAGLISIVLKSGQIASQSPSFKDLAGWTPEEARGNIRVSLEASDGHDFNSFCQSVVRDAGEPSGETFTQRDKVVGRSITVRFFTRAPGPPGLRNPEWLLLMRAVKLTLVGVQPQLAGEVNAAGKRPCTLHPAPCTLNPAP